MRNRGPCLWQRLATGMLLCLITYSLGAAPAKSARKVPKDGQTDEQVTTLNEVARDFGAVQPDFLSFPMKFTWTNRSETALKVAKALTSCHCASVKYPEIIAPGEKCEFVLTADLTGWKGNAAVSALLTFENKARLPLRLKGTFFVPERLGGFPKEIDLGEIADVAKAKQSFILSWVCQPEEAGMKLGDDARTGASGVASYRLIDSREDIIRLPDSHKRSRAQRFSFEMTLNPQAPPGPVNEVLRIPVQIEKEQRVALVPVRGVVLPRYYAVPANIVSTHVSGTQAKPSTIEIHRRGPTSAPISVTAKSDADFIAVAVNERSAAATGAAVTSLTVEPKLAGAPSDRLDGKVRISVREGDTTFILDLNVSFIRVQLTSTGN